MKRYWWIPELKSWKPGDRPLKIYTNIPEKQETGGE